MIDSPYVGAAWLLLYRNGIIFCTIMFCLQPILIVMVIPWEGLKKTKKKDFRNFVSKLIVIYQAKRHFDSQISCYKYRLYRICTQLKVRTMTFKCIRLWWIIILLASFHIFSFFIYICHQKMVFILPFWYFNCQLMCDWPPLKILKISQL